MKHAFKEARDWRQILRVVALGLIVGSLISVAASFLRLR